MDKSDLGVLFCKNLPIITLIKTKQNFPQIQDKEIQKVAVAKSYLTNGLLIYD